VRKWNVMPARYFGSEDIIMLRILSAFYQKKMLGTELKSKMTLLRQF